MNQKQLEQVYVGLGTNLGNRPANLKCAIDHLNNHEEITVMAQSGIYENPAIEEAGPEDFFNQVVLCHTTLSPREFLEELKDIERVLDPKREERGRKKARFIDLDILTYADLKIDEEDLKIPHPRMQERDFVMNPLNEVRTRIHRQSILMKSKDDPAIEALCEHSDFTRRLSTKEKQAVEMIDKYIASMSQFNFRPTLLEDIDELLPINFEAFGEKHWSRDIFVREMDNQYSIYYTVTDKNNKILAFIGFWIILDEMHVMTLAVSSEAKRQGIAEALLLMSLRDSFKARVRSVTLEVKANNEPAIALYDKYQFKKQGMRPKYYPDGQAALLLWTEEIYTDEYLDGLFERIEALKSRLVV